MSITQIGRQPVGQGSVFTQGSVIFPAPPPLAAPTPAGSTQLGPQQTPQRKGKTVSYTTALTVALVTSLLMSVLSVLATYGILRRRKPPNKASAQSPPGRQSEQTKQPDGERLTEQLVAYNHASEIGTNNPVAIWPTDMQGREHFPSPLEMDGPRLHPRQQDSNCAVHALQMLTGGHPALLASAFDVQMTRNDFVFERKKILCEELLRAMRRPGPQAVAVNARQLDRVLAKMQALLDKLSASKNDERISDQDGKKYIELLTELNDASPRGIERSTIVHPKEFSRIYERIIETKIRGLKKLNNLKERNAAGTLTSREAEEYARSKGWLDIAENIKSEAGKLDAHQIKLEASQTSYADAENQTLRNALEKLAGPRVILAKPLIDGSHGDAQRVLGFKHHYVALEKDPDGTWVKRDPLRRKTHTLTLPNRQPVIDAYDAVIAELLAEKNRTDGKSKINLEEPTHVFIPTAG